MKCRNIIIASVISLLGAAPAYSQTAGSGTETDFGGRMSIGAYWKIVKGLHLGAEYQLRAKDNFGKIDSHRADLGLSWSPVKPLEIGLGYTLIGSNKTSGFEPRHRFHGEITGSLRLGAWKLSLREMLLLTHRTGDFNRFQTTPNLLELKSRLKLSYKGFGKIDPYAYVELRNCFNAPSLSADYNSSTGKYTNYEFKGYGDTYINRVRASLGAKWNITRHHALDLSLLADWGSKKAIDTNADGTKLKSYQWEKSFRTSVSLGYCFSF